MTDNYRIFSHLIRNRPLPQALRRQYVWHIRKPLDLGAMQDACAHIMGQHDFKAFEGTGSPRSHTRRNVTRASWRTRVPDLIEFEIEADGFLRYMVRNLVGTFVDVGLGKKTVDDFLNILQSLDRSQASATAPPHGLCLVSVKY